MRVVTNHVAKDNNNAGTQGEANITYLRITFDQTWDGYAKTITWFNSRGENPVEMVLTTDRLENIQADMRVYLLPIPAEPLEYDGWCTFVIDGFINGVRQRTAEDRLKVYPAKTATDPGTPEDPTPSQAEQLQGQIDQILGDIQKASGAADAAEAAEKSAKDAAESAGQAAQSKTDAETAANRAEEATVHGPTIGNSGTWLVWDMALGAYVDTGIRAQGPQGIQGPVGDTGPQGEPGKPPVVGDNGHWIVWNGAEYIDTGHPATALVNAANGEYVDVWFGTVDEYNRLETIESNILYHILEGEIRV